MGSLDNKKTTFHCGVIGLGRFGIFWLNLLFKKRDVLLQHAQKMLPFLDAPVEKIQFHVFDTTISQTKMDGLRSLLQSEKHGGEKDGQIEEDFESFFTIGEKPSDFSELSMVFFCVPISVLSATLDEFVPHLNEQCVLLDTCSVKELPTKWMNKQSKKDHYILATHPLFGPDSFSDKNSRKIALCPVRFPATMLNAWIEFFYALGLTSIVLDAKEHDREVAFTQGLTHLLGRILTQLLVEDYDITTKGFQSLREIITQTCNDSQQLFCDLQRFNHYSSEVWQMFSKATSVVIKELQMKKAPDKETKKDKDDK